MTPRIAGEEREAGMYDLVPYDYAHGCWERLPADMRYDPVPPSHEEPEKDGSHRRCPTCQWPAGQRGFVRLAFPAGHELFGRAICCPRCWPAPFGHGQGGLSRSAQKVAAMWQNALDGQRR